MVKPSGASGSRSGDPRCHTLDHIDLRSLDAIHLAAALDLGDDLESIVTYDARLAAAASANGIAVSAPS